MSSVIPIRGTFGGAAEDGVSSTDANTSAPPPPAAAAAAGSDNEPLFEGGGSDTDGSEQLDEDAVISGSPPRRTSKTAAQAHGGATAGFGTSLGAATSLTGHRHTSSNNTGNNNNTAGGGVAASPSRKTSSVLSVKKSANASVTQPPNAVTATADEDTTTNSSIGGSVLAPTSAVPSSAAAAVVAAKPLRVKVVVVGDYSVGKSSLIRMLTQRVFQASMATIGVEFTEYSRFSATLDAPPPPTPSATASSASPSRSPPSQPSATGASTSQSTTAVAQKIEQRVVAQIWDIAGQQYCSSLTKQYYRGSSCAIVVGDMTRSDTFDVSLEWRADFAAKAQSEVLQSVSQALEAADVSSGRSRRGAPERALTPEELEIFSLPVYLLANKSDLVPTTTAGDTAAAGGGAAPDDHFMTEQAARLFAQRNKFAGFHVVSAKDYNTVSTAFHSILADVAQRRVRSEAYKARMDVVAAENNARAVSLGRGGPNKKGSEKDGKGKTCAC